MDYFKVSFILILYFCKLVQSDYTILDPDSERVDDQITRNKRQASEENKKSLSTATKSSVSTVTTNDTTTKPTTTPVTTTTTATSTTTTSTAATTTNTQQETLSSPSSTPNTLLDQHAFYSKQLYDDFGEFWVELYFGKVSGSAPSNVSTVVASSHEKLSVSYRTAAVVDLKFKFPFYGHPVDRVVIATGGFIYVGEILNPRLLTFSQFIAPLMANFDFSLGDLESKRLLYFSNKTMLIVEWRDVVLQEKPSLPFRFQVQIYETGRIVFVYKDIPLDVSTISQSKHPVEISLSDAYSSERYDAATKLTFQTMHMYSETKIPPDWVRSKSVVVLDPLPMCVSLTTCETCLTPSPYMAFKCAWCPELRRCSFGFDRGRKKWMNNHCDSKNISSRSACELLPPSQRIGESLFSKPISKGSPSDGASPTVGAWIILIILIILAIIAAVGLCIGWVVYAHRHPGSRAGIWLVEHRPSRLIHNGSDCIRRSMASARSWWSSAKPGSTDRPSSQPVATYNGGNNQPQQPYDVSVGGVTLSASRI